VELIIKRPLVWLLLAYTAGMGLYQVGLKFVILIAIILAAIITKYICFPWKEKKNTLKYHLFLYGLPFLLLFGQVRLNQQITPPSINNFFEDKINGTIKGQLESISDRGSYVILTLKNNIITISLSEQQFYSSKITVYSSHKNSYKIGNILLVSGQITKFKQATNPGQFDEQLYNRMSNIDYKITAETISLMDLEYSKVYQGIYNYKYKVINTFYGILPEKDAGILSAMILGEAELLDEEMKELYQKNGISHILAISGLHISILGISFYQLLSKLRIPLLPATLLSIGFILVYGILTNFSVSTNRSIVMLVVMMIAKVVGRTYDIISALSLSAIIILIQSPLQILNAGFLLSFGAILGIVLLYPVLNNLFSVNNQLLKGLILSISIQLMTLPILLYFFYELPVYSLLLNLIILPTASLIIILAVLTGVLGSMFLLAGTFLAGGAHYILSLYEFLCKIAVSLPGNHILVGRPSLIQIIAYYMILLLFLLVNCQKKSQDGYSSKSIILLSLLCIILFKSNNINLNVTFIDVGQGDGILMEFPNGATCLVDGGSADIKNLGKYRLEPFLKSKGIGELDYAVITHTDSDHIGGLKELMLEGNIKIHRLIMPEIAETYKEPAYFELVSLALDNDIRVFYITEGDTIREGDVAITCLHPSKNFIASSSNGYSTVLSIRYKEYDMLLTGDLELEGEDKLIYALQQEITGMDFDVLKVAHHGSRYSTSKELLDIIKPEIAVISYGKNNSYGHPHAELLHRLVNSKCNIYTTAQGGAIKIETDGYNVMISKYSSN
jgi:competence protein ComEC